MGPQLPQDRLDVRPEGRGGDPQRTGRIGRRKPLGEALQHLELAPGERLDDLPGSFPLEQQPLKLARGEEDLAGGRRTDPLDDVLESAVLRHVTDGARTGDIGQDRRRRIAGEDEHRRLGKRCPDGARDVRAGAVRQVIVGEDDIGPQLRQPPHRRRDVVDDLGHLDPRRAL